MAWPALADSEVDRLYEALGLPALLTAFAQDGEASALELDAGFLGGQGGDVYAETVRQLYDPERLDPGLRSALKSALDPQIARQALVFFETDMGARIIRIEVEARQAMTRPNIEATAMQAAPRVGDDVLALLSTRDLIERNTDITMAAQFAFWDALGAAAPDAPQPDLEGQRSAVADRTQAWVTGYYMLVASALETHDLDTYNAFWETDVGQELDTALYTAFQDVYVTLSFGLGGAVGRLLPQNDL